MNTISPDSAPSLPDTESWEKVRAAQRAWASVPLPHRLRIIVRLRALLVQHAEALARASAKVRQVDPAEVLTSELLPLAEACRFLENHAADVLAPRHLGPADRPLWLTGVRTEVRRMPHGLVLILAPSNYPLFLAGAQLLQALVAGNAVLLKPAPGAEEPLEIFGRLLEQAGLPTDLLTLLPTDPGTAHHLIRTQADKVFLTGGVQAGRAVLQTCADAIVPATVELSGVDSFHVLSDAAPAQAAEVLLYGLALNRGRTCISPRRIFVHRDAAPPFRAALKDRFRSRRAPVTELAPWAAEEISSALASGASLLAGSWSGAEGWFRYPLVLEGVPPDSRLWSDDHFGPVAVLQEVSSEEEAIALDQACPYALAASVFGKDPRRAAAFASRLPVNSVTINDSIVPTADPRLPFIGRKRSGFGATRGPEGLLEMTTPQVISRRPADAWLPHLDAPTPQDEKQYQHLLNLLHGSGVFSRLASLRFLMTRGGRAQRTTK